MNHSLPRVFAIALVLLAAVSGLAAAACGDAPGPHWQKLTSGSLSGTTPAKLDLGTYNLSGDVRLGWDLTGPDGARATFELSAARVDDDGVSVQEQGTSVRSWSGDFSPSSEDALQLHLRPDEWHLALSQRFKQSTTGYSGTYTLYVETQ